jgi:hypothetical protein
MLDTDSSILLLNCADKIDIESIVQELVNKPGKDVLPDKAVWNERNPGYSELFTMWESGNFNLSSAKWTNYYPDKDYSSSVTTIFEELLGVKTARAWISRVDPGYCTPWHWDTDDNEAHYLSLGKLKRYSCHISKPEFGHVFLLGKEAHYFWKQGDVHEWNNHHAWHAGFNCGIKPKFMLQLLAYK